MGSFIRELNLPADVVATSDDWGVAKPSVASFEKLIKVSGHEPDEIVYVGDRLDNDVAPAAAAGLRTAWIRRGPWGFLLEPGSTTPTGTVAVTPDLQFDSLVALPAMIDAT